MQTRKTDNVELTLLDFGEEDTRDIEKREGDSGIGSN